MRNGWGVWKVAKGASAIPQFFVAIFFLRKNGEDKRDGVVDKKRQKRRAKACSENFFDVLSSAFNSFFFIILMKF